ncbi:hypothetical protein D3C84_490440 [compost metagenome]
MFRGAVDTHFRCGAEACNRSGIDDGTTALGQQQRQLVLHAQPDPLDVDPHDRVELGLAAFGQLALFDFDTGIVEGVVQTPIGAQGLGHQLLHVGIAGHVATDENGLPARGTDQSNRAFTTGDIQIGHHHLQALGGKCQRRRPANPCGRTGDHCHLPGKRHAHQWLLRSVG